MNRYISIKELAAIVGVSEQAVYKRLSTSLKPYSTTVEGKKKIDIRAVSEVYGKSLKSTVENQDLTNLNVVETMTQDELLIEALRKELDTKNQQIEALNKSIDNLSSTVTSLTEQLGDSQKMLLQQQQLHYISMGGKLQPDEAEPVEPMEPAEDKEPKEKKGLFKVFSRKK